MTAYGEAKPQFLNVATFERGKTPSTVQFNRMIYDGNFVQVQDVQWMMFPDYKRK